MVIAFLNSSQNDNDGSDKPLVIFYHLILGALQQHGAFLNTLLIRANI